MQRVTLVVLPLVLLLVGCPGPIVNTPSPARLEGLRARPGTRLLLADLATRRPDKGVRGDLRMRSMHRRLASLLGRDGVEVLDERDVGGMPGAGTYVLRLELADWQEDTHNPPEWVICVVVGTLTAGLGLLPCAGTRVSTDHRLEIEARLYDAAGAQVRRVAEGETGEIELRVDTSERTPLLRRTYELELRAGLAVSGGVSQADFERFEREQGERVAELLVERIAQDVARSIDRAAAAPPQVLEQVAPTSGGEVLVH